MSEANEMMGVYDPAQQRWRGGQGRQKDPRIQRLGGETWSGTPGALGDGQLRLGLYHGRRGATEGFSQGA